ncbi:hypothetical protein HRbin11_01426 [bacterium HR11]|nr:hypothetical protein HRbin11_01426 [bacterium HR11]
MQVFRCPTPDEMGKFRGVVAIFRHIWTGSVLDVGCRSGRLREAHEQVSSNIDYVGLDLYPPADVIGDLEKGLPFPDAAFDIVVALDVLEHTNDIYKSFDELCRCARRFVVISLPNAYEIRGRLKFLLGMRLSGKYGLPIEPPKDRHRWIFSLNEAREFVRRRAEKRGFVVRDEGCLIGPRRFFLGSALVGRLPNLFCPTYLVLLERL